MDEADRGQDLFTIGELAAAFTLSPRAIRFYEDQGLLSPRRAGTQRIYTRRDRARLQLILRGKRLGFSIADIGRLLEDRLLIDGSVRFDRLLGRCGQVGVRVTFRRFRRGLDRLSFELRGADSVRQFRLHLGSGLLGEGRLRRHDYACRREICGNRRRGRWRRRRRRTSAG